MNVIDASEGWKRGDFRGLATWLLRVINDGGGSRVRGRLCGQASDFMVKRHFVGKAHFLGFAHKVRFAHKVGGLHIKSCARLRALCRSAYADESYSGNPHSGGGE